MNYEYCKENIDEVLPIESIDGVIVTVSIKKCHKGETHFKIEIDNNNYYGAWLSVNTPEDFDKTMDTLQHMKFNTFTGHFYDERTPILSIHGNKLKDSSFYEKLSSFKNIKMNFGECCICYENTRSKTTCNHFICDRCHSNMKRNVCPLCRKDLDEYEEDE